MHRSGNIPLFLSGKRPETGKRRLPGPEPKQRRFLERDLPHDVEAKHFIRALRMEGERVVDIYAPAVECAAVYDRESLWDCTYLRQQAINTRHMKNGVTFLDPNQAYIDAEVTIGEDTVIYPGVFLQGDTRIGRDCTLYNGCRLLDTIVGDGCSLAAVVAQEAAVEVRTAAMAAVLVVIRMWTTSSGF